VGLTGSSVRQLCGSRACDCTPLQGTQAVACLYGSEHDPSNTLHISFNKILIIKRVGLTGSSVRQMRGSRACDCTLIQGTQAVACLYGSEHDPSHILHISFNLWKKFYSRDGEIFTFASFKHSTSRPRIIEGTCSWHKHSPLLWIATLLGRVRKTKFRNVNRCFPQAQCYSWRWHFRRTERRYISGNHAVQLYCVKRNTLQ
jgi:hypothetical protein